MLIIVPTPSQERADEKKQTLGKPQYYVCVKNKSSAPKQIKRGYIGGPGRKTPICVCLMRERESRSFEKKSVFEKEKLFDSVAVARRGTDRLFREMVVDRRSPTPKRQKNRCGIRLHVGRPSFTERCTVGQQFLGQWRHRSWALRQNVYTHTLDRQTSILHHFHMEQPSTFFSECGHGIKIFPNDLTHTHMLSDAKNFFVQT